MWKQPNNERAKAPAGALAAAAPADAPAETQSPTIIPADSRARAHTGAPPVAGSVTSDWAAYFVSTITND